FWEERRSGRLANALDALRPGPGEDDLRGFEWHYLRHQGPEVEELSRHRGVVFAVAAAGGGGQVASVSADGAVQLLDVRRGREGAGWSLDGRACRGSLAFSAGARGLVSYPPPVPSGSVRPVTLWDVVRRKPLAKSVWPAREVFCVAVSPDGRTVAVGGARAD